MPTRAILRTIIQPRSAKPSSRDNSSDPPNPSSSSDSSSSSSWLLSLCLPLWLVYISNQWSRFSINSLVDFSSQATAFQSMNVELGFNQAQYGLLASVAFTSLFALASLGAGYVSDRFDRKLLTVGSALVWSFATLSMAHADSYSMLVLGRVLTGLACAFSTPAAYTLLQQKVPPERTALASSLYGTGVALASALTALSIELDNQLGWRSTLSIIGAFGLASALVSTLLLPGDTKDDDGLNSISKAGTGISLAQPLSQFSFLKEVEEILQSSPRVQWLYLGSLLRFGSGLSIGIWSAPFFRLAFPDDQSSYAAWQAGISAIGATVSGIAGGALADWLSSTSPTTGREDVLFGQEIDPVGRRLWIPVIGSLLAVPTWYFAIQPNQPFETSMYWLAAEYFVAECWFGPTISTLQASVRPGTGGTAQGIFTLTGAIGNLAPSLIGILYSSAVVDATSSSFANNGNGGESVVGVDALSSLLVAGVCFGYLASAACFALASQSASMPSSSRSSHTPASLPTLDKSKPT